jgi:hypothetical protein
MLLIVTILRFFRCMLVFGLFGLILISDPLGPGMPFLDINTYAEGGLFIFAKVFFLV